MLQYRCRVGHAFSAETLVAGQSETQEEALWAAIRSLEERVELMRKLAANARQRNHNLSAQRFEAQAQEAQQRSELIRQALFQGQLPDTAKPAATGQENSNAASNVVVVAGAAGGVTALSQILRNLPLNFPAAIIVVQHLDTQSDSSLIADALSRPTTLPLKHAQEGNLLRPGMVYIAPPNQHLLVTPNATLCLSQAAFVDFACPSADLLFQSVAASFKERAIAVVLSGTGSDGAMGVKAIHKMGGKVIVQDQSNCDCLDMPSAAIATGTVDFVLPVGEIAATAIDLVMTEKN